jgi:predicted RNA binding protein YcfA (HicA-like mRNA interferase family)
MSTDKFPRYIRSSKIIKILLIEGFKPKKTKGKGTHNNFSKKGVPYVVTVSSKKNIPMGTVYNIIKRAQITRDRFLELYDEV